MTSKKTETFFSNGLQFECTKCGKCCTTAPGYVYISENDIVKIAKFLGLDKKSFIIRYTRIVAVFGERRYALTEKSNYDCIFWNKSCTIYPVRPYQCRSYPFWKQNLISCWEWQKVGNRCPGINRGRIHTAGEIVHFLQGVPNYNIEWFRDSIV